MSVTSHADTIEWIIEQLLNTLIDFELCEYSSDILFVQVPNSNQLTHDALTCYSKRNEFLIDRNSFCISHTYTRKPNECNYVESWNLFGHAELMLFKTIEFSFPFLHSILFVRSFETIPTYLVSFLHDMPASVVCTAFFGKKTLS